MGSFSWLKADFLTQTVNIVIDESFKFLIPKEFDTTGKGYIKDRYRDYGYLGEIAPEDKFKSNQMGKYDMYELLAIFNSDYITDKDMDVRMYSKDETVHIPAGSRIGDYLKGVDSRDPLKSIDADTEFNRLLGIKIGCYEDSIDKLPYPLKLVSASYKGSYEQCAGRSYADPEQGWRRLSRDSLYYGARYDGTAWEDVYKEWERQDKAYSKNDRERD